MVSYKFTKKDFQSVLRKAEFFISALPDTKKVYRIEIKEHKEKRSLDANAYCFLLIDKISEATKVSKEDIYKEAIKQISGNSEIVCVKKEAAESLKKGWEQNGLGWVTEEMPSKIDGCVNVILYSGSSVYDTKQMSTLIDRVVQDCIALGIETLSEEKLALLKGEHDA